MTRRFRLAVLVLLVCGSQAVAAPIYEITVSIRDDTTATLFPLITVAKGSAEDVTAPATPNFANIITVGGAFDTGATGVDINGLTSVTNNPGTALAAMSLGGTVAILPGVATSKDQFTIILGVSQTNFSSPTGPDGQISVSTSSTLSRAPGALTDRQTVRGTYDVTNTIFGIGTDAGPIGYLLPKTGTTPLSLASNTAATAISVAPSLYSLSEFVVITLTGNGSNPNTLDVFTSGLLVHAVPEPAGLILMGMGLPLMILWVVRRVCQRDQQSRSL